MPLGSRCCRLGWIRRWRRRPLVVAFFIGTRNDGPSFQILFHQILAAATRALFGDGLVGRSKLALRIISATVERVAFARALFDQVSVFALRALHADVILLDVLALGIPAAGGELAEASVSNHHVAAALRAEFVERNVGNFLALIETARGLAIGIARASHELAEAPALQHHHPAAILAVLFCRARILHVGGVEIRQVDRIFFSKRAGIGIVLVVGAAR